MSLADRWRAELCRLREQGRYRQLAVGSGIDFTSNDYLGYTNRFQPTMISAPPSGTASRLLRGHHPVWDEVESRLAQWHGAEAAIIMNSGYTANEGLLTTIIRPEDWVASDEHNHASLIDGIRASRAQKFIYRHQDLNHLEDGLRQAVRVSDRECFIVTESLFSMDGDLTPLRELAEIADRYGAHLIVDEAHATGCFGITGGGRVDELGLRASVLATVHTGGKALAVGGAYIVGSRLLRDWLVNHCRHLIYTTALPPLLGPLWLTALERVTKDNEGRQRLHENSRFFRQSVQHEQISLLGSQYIIPIVLGDDRQAVNVARTLQQRGFDVRPIRPPSVPPGTARLRISIHADHDPSDLRRLAATIRELLTPS
jgi:8-amino-7-oxononanoate synthase